jgi:hypothetical protein
MTDEREHPTDEAPLPAAVIASMRRGPTTRPEVERRTIDALRHRGLLGAPRRAAYLPWLLGSSAAGVAFAAGLFVGRGGPVTPSATTTIDVAGRPVSIQLAPNEPALLMIRAALDSSIARAPLAGRAVPAPARTVTWF